jgi:hypothetical protein
LRTCSLYFPTGELLCGIIDNDQAGSIYCSFLLPLGLVCPAFIGFAKCKEIVQALGKAYKPFVSLLDAIKPQLHHWFVAVSAHLERFSIPSCNPVEEIAPAFPSISNGTYPKQISNPRGFSPLVNTRHAFLWHLHCDQVLAMTSGPGQLQFNTFLQQGEAGMTAATNLVAAIPPLFRIQSRTIFHELPSVPSTRLMARTKLGHPMQASGLLPPAHLSFLKQPFIPQQVQPFSPPPIWQSTPH